MRSDMLSVLAPVSITTPSWLCVCNMPKIMIPQCGWIRWKSVHLHVREGQWKGERQRERETDRWADLKSSTQSSDSQVCVCVCALAGNAALCFSTRPCHVPPCVRICVSMYMCLWKHVAQEGWPCATRHGANPRLHTLPSLDSQRGRLSRERKGVCAQLWKKKNPQSLYFSVPAVLVAVFFNSMESQLAFKGFCK